MHGTNGASPLPDLLESLGRMTAIRDTHLLEQTLLRTLVPMLETSDASIYRVDDAHEISRGLHFFYSSDPVGRDPERPDEHIVEILSDKDIPEVIYTLINDVRHLDRVCTCAHEDALMIAYPLHGGDDLRGYFLFSRAKELDPADDTLLRGVLEIFSNYYALLDTSQRDRLTGLHNRYSLEINLDRLWSVLSARLLEESADEERRDIDLHNYWIGVLDIDHFKRINDTWGHIIGDEVLLLVAQLMQQSFRRSDLIYRYGGEEFVAIIAANDLAGAISVFERARKTIEATAFPQVGHITISGGFSGADPKVLPQMVINRADRSLYQAKNDGRNRIYHYDTLIKQGVLKELVDGSVDLF